MRTVQRTYTLFDIAELEETARQKAYTDWLAKGNDYPYASENCDTLEAFCNLFRIACTNYRYDSCTYAYRFHTGHEEETERLSSVRLFRNFGSMRRAKSAMSRNVLSPRDWTMWSTAWPPTPFTAAME